MVHSNSLSACCIVMLVASTLAAQSLPESPESLPADSRQAAALAVISDRHTRDLGALLQVDLSGRGMRMVEREALARVLDEQEFATGFTGDDAVRLGRLVGADGVLVLGETTDAEKRTIINARLVAAGAGVVLWSYSYVGDDRVEWLSRIAERVELSAGKLAVRPGEATALSIVNIRGEFKTSASLQLERELTLLLTHRLAQEPAIFVLERQRMELLLREKQIAGADASWWTGGYLLDGTLAMDAQEQFTVSMRLRNADGEQEQAFLVQGQLADVADAVNQMAIEVVGRVRGDVDVQAWDPAKEAALFAEEARWADACDQDWQTVKSVANAAWALGHRDRELAVLKIHSLMRQACGGRYDETFYHNYTRASRRVPMGIMAIAESDDEHMRDRLHAATDALRLFMDQKDKTLPKAQGRDDTVWAFGAVLQEVATLILQACYENRDWKRLAPEMAEVRAWIRRIDAWQETQDKTILDSVERGNRLYYAHKAAYAPWWFDSPDEQIEAYQQALASPSGWVGRSEIINALTRVRHKPGTPHLIAWHEFDEPSMTGVWDRFVQELCEAPRHEHRIVGYRLMMDKGKADEWRARIFQTFRDNPDDVRRARLSLGLIDPVFLGLKGDQPHEPPYRDFYWQLLMDAFRSNEYAWIEYMLAKRYGLSRGLSSEQAAEVHDALVKLHADPALARHRRFLTLTLENFRAKYPHLHEPTPAEGALVAVQPDWPGLAGQTQADSRYMPGSSTWHGGRLWVPTRSAKGSFIVGIQLTGTDHEIIEIPGEIAAGWFRDHGEFHLAVTPEAIFVVYQTYARTRVESRYSLVSYDRLNATWRVYDQAPHELAGIPVIIGPSLYCRFREPATHGNITPSFQGLIQVDLKSGDVSVLASNRRMPARTPLDTLDYDLELLTATPEGELLVVATAWGSVDPLHRRVYGYQPQTNAWRIVPPVEWSQRADARRVLRQFSLTNTRPEGEQYRWNDSNAPEFWTWRRDVPLESDVDLQLAYGESSLPGLIPIPVWLSPDRPVAEAVQTGVGSAAQETAREPARRDIGGIETALFTPDGVLIFNRHGSSLRWFIPMQQLRKYVAQHRHEIVPPPTAPDGNPALFAAQTHQIHQIWMQTDDGPIQLTRGFHESMQPVLSPDGKQIAFMSYRDDNADIFLMNADGSQLRNLTNSWDEELSPAWSPDGKQLAYVSRFGGKSSLCVMNIDTDSRQVFLSEDNRKGSVQWSPDGRQLLFSVVVSPELTEHYAFDLETESVTPAKLVP